LKINSEEGSIKKIAFVENRSSGFNSKEFECKEQNGDLIEKFIQNRVHESILL